MLREAEFSACCQYRFWLSRDWSNGESLFPHGDGAEVVFIGLNPSIADAETDDQTIKKYIGFAKRWGFDRFTALNLVPYIDTNPNALLDVESRIEAIEKNWQIMYEQTKNTDLVIVCWGYHPVLKETRADVVAMTEYIEGRPECLGTTSGGYPRHLSRLGYDTARVPYRLPSTKSE